VVLKKYISGRVDHPVNVERHVGRVYEWVRKRCLPNGIDPCSLIRAVFNEYDKRTCQFVFHLSYPPVEFITSEHALRRFGGNCLSVPRHGRSCGFKQEDELASSMTDHGFELAVKTGMFSDRWLRRVRDDVNHPRHALVGGRRTRRRRRSK